MESQHYVSPSKESISSNHVNSSSVKDQSESETLPPINVDESNDFEVT